MNAEEMNRFTVGRRDFVGGLLAASVFSGYGTPSSDGTLRIAHCCDPQFGMGRPRQGNKQTEKGYLDDLARLEREIEILNGMDIDLVYFAGDMCHEPEFLARDWPRLLKKLRHPVVAAPGNHDIGNRVKADLVAKFKEVFGAEYQSLDVKGWRIVVGNSQYWFPTDAVKLRQDYERWLSEEFAAAKASGKPVILAAHYPPFIRSADEKDGYSNCPIAIRSSMLSRYIDAGAKFYLAGHTHTTLRRSYRGMEILNAETTCWNFDDRPFGFRLLTIRPDSSYDWDFVEVPSAPVVYEQFLTAMSFNVCHGKGMDGKVDLERTAAAINRAKPCFAGLSEIDRCARRTGGADQPAELARLTGMVPTFAPAIPLQNGEYGVMLLSLEKPFDVKTFPLPGKEPRVLLLCEFANFHVGVTHLSVSAERERMESVGIIRDAIAGCGKPVFLTGDWNALPDSPVLAEFGKFLTVVSEITGRTYHGSTSNDPGKDTGFCIDYIAIDSKHAAEWKVLSRETVADETTSDHKPITATVARLLLKDS